MNRIWYYTPDDRTDHPDINLLTPGMGVLTVLCVCLIPASAQLPQLPNPFHILLGYTTLVALNLLWQGRRYFSPRPLPSPMFACDDDGLTVFDRDGARLGNWRWADIAELRATEPDPVAVIRGGADPDAVWLEIVLREAAPYGFGESDRLRRWLDAIEPQRGQIAIHVHLSEAVPGDHAPTTRLHLGAAATDTLADALSDIDRYHQGAALPPPRRPPNPYRADVAAILTILAATAVLPLLWHLFIVARLLIHFSLPLIAVFNLWAAVRLCQAGIAFTKIRRHAPPPARVSAQAPAIAAQPAPQPPPAPDSVRPRPAPRRKPRSITPPAAPRPTIAARAWYTDPRTIRRANIHNYGALAIALVLIVRLIHGTPHPVWHAAGLLLALAYAAAITFTAFHQPGAPRLQIDANGIRSCSDFLPWDDYSYATINERPTAFTHQPRPVSLDIHGLNRRLPISIDIAIIGYRAAQDIIAACNHGKAQYRATAAPDDANDLLEQAYRRTIARSDLTPAEQANLRDLVDALKDEADTTPPAASPAGDDTAALRAEIQQQHPPAVAEALLRYTRHLNGKADNRRSYPLHIRPLAWALLIANNATALALAVLIALKPPAVLAAPLLAWLVALTAVNLIAWLAPWRWQAVAKTPEKEQPPSLAGRSPQRGRVGEGVAIVNIRPSAADIPPHQWYKHPRAIARGNWHTFAWLTTAALLAMLTSRGVASGHAVALALLLPLALAIRAAWQAARHAFSHHDAPLVRLDADGIHLALKNRRQRDLARLPTRGASLHAGATHCHIPWDEIAYISALEANRYRAQQLLIEDQDGDNHGIYSAPLGDYDTVCTIAATARVCCDHDHWPMPGHDALPPPRLRPFARILLAANIALITIWLALNLLVQQGLMTLPFADPALPLLELPPFHLHAILPFGAYPHTNALILLSLTALNLAAWLAPWHWQAEAVPDEENPA